MSAALHIDFESRSACDLKTRGVYNYMDHPTTQPLFASYKIGTGTKKRWDASQPCPADIVEHVRAGRPIKAHNAAFERLLMQKILAVRYGWPMPALEQFVCTAATAAALSLPRDLAGLSEALALKVKKDKEGTRLIRKFCIPRKARKDEDPAGIYFNEPHEFPEDWEKFKNYCDDDVGAEAEADGRMVPLSQADLERYWRSERINDRGLRIDTISASAALSLAEKARKHLDREIVIATAGYVGACSQVAKLTAWVQSQGVTMESAAKAEIEELLELEDLPTNVRRAVELRQEYAKTSVSKLVAFLNRVSADGRLRGAFLFRAAGTGRYSSLGAQLHNLPRPRKEFGDAHLDLQFLFDAFRWGSPEWLRTMYGAKLGKTLWLISDAIRGFLWAAPGHDLLASDYSGIEGAVAAWFADEDWKVQALHDIIADPSKPDLYRRAAAGIMNSTTDIIDKKHPLRQSVGKTSELSLQYQGGVGAFYSMARNYSLKIHTIFEPVWNASDEERQERAVKRYDECLARNEVTTQKMTREAWLAAELVKVGWRNLHPGISGSWPMLEDAIYEAVTNPGTIVSVLKVKYLVRGGFLWCLLPSGRCLAYGSPRVQQVEVPWANKEDPPEKREKKLAVTVLGSVQVSKTKSLWMRYALYGGLAFENIVQAIALDLLDNGIELAEAAGYPVVGHVHDEIIAELPHGQGDIKEFSKLICQLPAWAEGLPLTASGWRGKRYRKD